MLDQLGACKVLLVSPSNMGDWSCTKCTTNNKHNRTKCKSCRAERSSLSLEEMYAQQSLIEWQCIRCSTTNNGNMIQCKTCRCIGTWCLEVAVEQDSSQAGIVKSLAPRPHSDDRPNADDLSSEKEISSKHDQADESSSTEPLSELRIVMLGRTGEGKSASGNTILGSAECTSTSSPASVTKTCQRGKCNKFDRIIQVVDTPGMFDTEMSTADITREVVRCVGMTAPGPHVFLLVLTPGRHTEEVQNTVDHFMKIFGDGMLKHLIVLFTRKDDLIHNGESIEEYIERDSGKLKTLLKSCQYRYVAFNNRGTPSAKEEDVNNLLCLIDEIVQENKGVYTSEMFEQAEKLMKEKEEKLKKEHDEDLKRQSNRIREECAMEVQELEANYEEITKQFQARLAELEHQPTTKSKEESADISRQLWEMEAQHREEIRRIEEGARVKSVKKSKVNYRERAREEINNDSSFVKETLLPGLFQVAAAVLPALLKMVGLLVKKS